MENPTLIPGKLYNVILAPDLCDRLFSIIMLMNLGHTCLFHKGFFTVFFVDKNITLWHYRVSHKENMHFWFLKTKEKSKSQKQIPKKNFSLELLHQILGHRSTKSLLAVDTANIWQDIEIRVYPDAFFTTCHISTINWKDR